MSFIKQQNLKYLYLSFFMFLFFLVGVAGLVRPTAVHAAGLIVDSTADTIANDGACTLREAITNANNDDQSGSTDCTSGSGADTITFSIDGTIILSTTLPAITSEMAIDGAGQMVTISGNNTVRVLLVNASGVLTLNALTIADGYAGEFVDGGGIFNQGTLTVNNSTFFGNSAGASGGAIANTKTATIINSTFSGNSDYAIFHSGYSSGNMTISHSTIAGNSGGFVYTYSGATLKNTLVTNNGTDCYEPIPGGGLTADSTNMDSDGSCDNATTQTPAQLNLSTLADNGGETQTIALLAGSTAINHIPVEVNGCGSSINTDQRGVARPVGSGCDVGAYEFQPCTGFSMTAANETDLNNAIACFNQEFTPEAVTTTTYTITLTADITLTAATEPIDSTTTGTVLIVAGNGFTVDGQGILGVRPFEIKTDTIVHMSDFTITGGHVSGFGGGILNDGHLTLTNMSVLSNTTGSSGGGGGIHNYSNGMMTIVNSTLSHNESETGGGINNAGTLTLNHVTMSGNIESGGGDGAALANFGTLTMANSIVANSINNNNCFDWGSYTSYGYNISDDASCHFLTATGDISGTNPLLAPLADNGGGTMTHALLANSPAINHIPPGVNGCGTTITNDQRGIVRPQNSGCDIGSYEVENTPPVAAADAYNTDEDTPLTVTAPGVLDNDNDVDSDPLTALLVNDVSSGALNLELDGSLVYTPNMGFVGDDIFTYKANDGSADSNVVTVTITVIDVCPTFPITAADEATLNYAIACYNVLTTPGSYTINVTADMTLITHTTPIDNSYGTSLQINGNDHTVDGADSYRHFTISDSDVTIAGITLQNGNAIEDCGNIGVLPKCGGAIKVESAAIVTMTNTTILSNTASLGGGLFNAGGMVTINNSTISNNSVNYRGGGLGNRDGIMTISNSTISNNTSAYVAGISNESNGSITINGSTISGNVASLGGGGLYSEGDMATISNSTISGNSVTSGSDGGVRNHFSTMVISNSTIVGNSASTIGGGLSNAGDTLTVRNSIIADNTSGGDCAGVDTASIDDTNLDSDGTCGDAVQSANINLGPLQNNGGSTFTHALLAGSAAINAGDDAVCTAAPVNNLDQRGMARPQGIGCDIGAYEAELAALAIYKDGSGAGFVSSDPAGIDCGITCTTIVPVNSVVTLTAVPNPDSYFSGWSGDVVSAGNPITVTVDSDKHITATFALVPPVTYTLTTAVVGNGSITPDSGIYISGTVISLTAVADAGWQFAGWSGDVSGVSNPQALTMDSDKVVTATFVPEPVQTYTLAISLDGTGQGTVTSNPAGITCAPTCAASFEAGMMVTLTAVTETGSTFVGWQGACSGTGDCVVTMAEAVTVTAVFNTTPTTSTYQLYLPFVTKP